MENIRIKQWTTMQWYTISYGLVEKVGGRGESKQELNSGKSTLISRNRKIFMFYVIMVTYKIEKNGYAS